MSEVRVGAVGAGEGARVAGVGDGGGAGGAVGAAVTGGLRGRVTLSSRVSVHPDTALQQVGGRWMAATADDRLHTFEDDDGAVSEVGERIVALVDGRRTVQDIVDALLLEFEVSRQTCEADTLAFVEQLVARQVLGVD